MAVKNALGFVLHFVNRAGSYGCLDFTAGESDTAKQFGQDFANQGYTNVALAAATFSSRRKKCRQYDYEVIETFKPVKVKKVKPTIQMPDGDGSILVFSKKTA